MESDIKVIIYVDDGIATFRGSEIAKSVAELVRNDLLPAGLVINNEKCDFNPKVKGKCLGAIIDTRELTFTVPLKKIKQIFRGYNHVFNSRLFDPKIIIKGSRTTFCHAFVNRLIVSTFY